MTRYLSLAEVLALHRRIINETGGSDGLRDLGLLESALGQPRQTFGGEDLYPTLVAKATALGFSLIKNHPFVDGNKRTALMCALVFLGLNGWRLEANAEAIYELADGVAEGSVDKADVAIFLRQNSVGR